MRTIESSIRRVEAGLPITQDEGLRLRQWLDREAEYKQSQSNAVGILITLIGMGIIFTFAFFIP